MRELTQAESAAMAAIERWMTAYKAANGRLAPAAGYRSGWVRFCDQGGWSQGYRTHQVIKLAEELEGRALLAEARDER